MRAILIAILSIFIASPAFTQGKKAVDVLPLNLQYALSNAQPYALTHLYVKADEQGLKQWLEEHNGKLKYPFRSYHAVVLPAVEVSELAAQSFVERLHFEYTPGMPLLSNSLVQTNTNHVHTGDSGLPSAYTGEGVIVGVIDAGIELQHPDFMKPDSSTRIIELWDQNLPYDAQLTPSYGYGQVWDSAAINAGICPHQDQTQWFGHGTNTTGIAASNGLSNAEYTGFAPDAELIIVSSDFGAIGWTSTVADAVDYIFSKAEQLGKPCVINASIGTYLGSHDARDMAAQAIEQSITADDGRIMVCAAGNSGNAYPYHLGYTASSDTNFTWFEVNPSSAPGQGLIFFELYGDVDDFERLQFSIGADKVNGGYAFRGATEFDSVLNRLNFIYYDTLISPTGNVLSTVQTWADSLNGTYRLQVLMPNLDSVAYRYRLQVTGSGRFDLWSAEWLGLRNMSFDDLPNAQVYPPIQYYRAPDLEQSIVSSWACSDKVVTVGNYNNRSSYIDVDGNQINTGVTAGEIALNSSFGPARTQIIKPELAAPGDFTLTAGAFFQLNNLLNNPSQRFRVAPGGLHHRAGGTSSASPAVAGIGALFLEKCSGANWNDFKQALIQNAFADAFTAALPNYRWGYGKVDALATLKSTTPQTNLLYLADEVCQGDSMELVLTGTIDSVVWVNGAIGDILTVSQTGQYFASVYDSRGCMAYSDTVNFIVRPLPAIPSITIDADTPACAGEIISLTVSESFGAYEWSTGDFTQSIELSESGLYHCTVFNQYGCGSTSDALNVNYFPEQPSAQLHYQASGKLVLLTDYSKPTAYEWRLNNEALPSALDSLWQPIVLGVYQASYEDSNACQHWSSPLNVFALDAADTESRALRVFPNPIEDVINVQSESDRILWELLDAQGRRIRRGESVGSFAIETTRLAKGTYHLKLLNKGQIIHKKLIK